MHQYARQVEDLAIVDVGADGKTHVDTPRRAVATLVRFPSCGQPVRAIIRFVR